MKFLLQWHRRRQFNRLTVELAGLKAKNHILKCAAEQSGRQWYLDKYIENVQAIGEVEAKLNMLALGSNPP